MTLNRPRLVAQELLKPPPPLPLPESPIQPSPPPTPQEFKKTISGFINLFVFLLLLGLVIWLYKTSKEYKNMTIVDSNPTGFESIINPSIMTTVHKNVLPSNDLMPGAKSLEFTNIDDSA